MQTTEQLYEQFCAEGYLYGPNVVNREFVIGELETFRQQAFDAGAAAANARREQTGMTGSPNIASTSNARDTE